MTSETANKRTPDQVLRDRLVIADRYCRGETQATIAADLGVSRQQVSYDLAAIRRDWQRQMVATIDAHKAEQLAKIDVLEREYWMEYERSKQPFTKTVQHAESLKAKDQETKPQRARAIKTVEERLGDSRYLSGVQWCISERCKILGLNAPEKRNITVEIGQMADRIAAEDGLTDGERDELIADVQRYLAGAVAE